VVAVNRSEEPVSTDFAAPEDWGGEAQDLWNDETVAVTDGRVRVEVPPLGARILAAAAPGAD
jgi:hypothetical protein